MSIVDMTNVIKFQAPFERLKSYNSSPDVSLRRAIITQAIIDASNNSNTNKEAKKIELEAKSWLFGNSAYFAEICIEAGLEKGYVVKIAKEIIKIHDSKNQKTSLKKAKEKMELKNLKKNIASKY